MEEKDKFDACMKMSDFAIGRWDGRRQYEWRVTLGFWAVLIAALVYLKADALPVWLGLVVLGLHGTWLRNVWIRHSSDAEIAWHYFHQAQNILLTNGINIVPTRPNLRIGRGEVPRGIRSYVCFIGDWGIGFQFFCTAALLGLIYFADAKTVTLLSVTNLVITNSPP